MSGERPPSTAGVAELAAYWAANAEELSEMSSWLFQARKRLTDAVKDGGPIITPAGRLKLEANGYEYPPEIATAFPGLGRHVVSATVDTVDQAERLLDLITEQDHKAQIAHEIMVDGRAAAQLVNQGGPAAKQLLDMRVAKGRLAVAK